MSPIVSPIVDALVAAVGGVALFFLFHLRNLLGIRVFGATIWGTLCLIVAGAAAYFRFTIPALVLALVGVACWSWFLWNVKKTNKRGDI